MKTTAKGIIVLAALVLATGLAACTGGEDAGALKPTSTPTVQDALAGPPTVDVLAPIEKVEVLIRESWPPQYVIQVTSGLPNGCAQFESISHAIHGDRIEVDVINTEPGPGVLAKCSAIYGYETNDVIITDVLDAGVTFTVVVNGVEETFVGQGGPNVEPPAGTTGDGYETAETLAPVETVEVQIRESWPPQYVIRVTSGLPSGCAEFERITYSIKGDRIEVEVINTEPAPDELVACTADYRYATNEVVITDVLAADGTYTVSANGVETSFVGQGGPDAEPPAGTTGDGYETVEVAAPIERIEILIMESFPVQYAVSVVSGLPGGCARFERITHSTKGDRIEIEVINTEPAPDELVACTRIYGYSENTVQLGTDFQPGTTYTVAVNGTEETFVAQ